MPRLTRLFSGLAPPEWMAAPLRERVFRRIWLASLLSNLGLLVQGVGSAWAMTELTSSADMVALVQTALMLPIMLTSLLAGAVADMYDRRIVSIAALLLSLVGACALTLASSLDLLTPALLLGLCFTVGSGMALFGPAWQASVSEQVPVQVLPSAIALNSVSFNIARSLGPAIGGVIVAALGVAAAFFANAVLYLPILLVFYLWRRPQEPPRLPPENLGRAMALGVRYLVFAPRINVVVMRTFATGLLGGSVAALMPLVARNMLSGGALTYGVLLGAFGLGAVGGAIGFNQLRHRFRSEILASALMVVMGLAVLIVGVSRSSLLTAVALVVAGAAWTAVVTLFNVGIQLSAPRWVTGRALAAFQAAIAGGVALGSWGWGWTAEQTNVGAALLISGAGILLSPLLGLLLRIPELTGGSQDSEAAGTDVDVRLAVTGRSGPILIELEYMIDPADARQFFEAMQEVQSIRRRNGAYGWTIARDIARPECWTERFHFPTWLDYLRHRDRPTPPERIAQAAAWTFHKGDGPPRIRRLLERPFGSVRWKEASPDRGVTEVLPLPPGSGAT